MATPDPGAAAATATTDPPMRALADGGDSGPAREHGAHVARLYAQHGRALYGLCVMLLRDSYEAEDALQSAFLSAYGALLRGGSPRDEGAWLAAIVRNECRGRIRVRMETPLHEDAAVLEEMPDLSRTPAETVTDPVVRRALAALSESQREAVVLHDVLGLRSREVGDVLGLSRPAVEALLFRARRQLRLRLKPVGILVVPAAVGHALAQAIPGFVAPAAAAGIAGTAGGVAGAGVLAKLAATPTAAKVTAGLAAAATAGSVAAVEVAREPVSRPHRPPSHSAPAVVAREGSDAGASGPETSSVGLQSAAQDTSGSDGRGHHDRSAAQPMDDRDGGSGHSGPGSGGETGSADTSGGGGSGHGGSETSGDDAPSGGSTSSSSGPSGDGGGHSTSSGTSGGSESSHSGGSPGPGPGGAETSSGGDPSTSGQGSVSVAPELETSSGPGSSGSGGGSPEGGGSGSSSGPGSGMETTPEDGGGDSSDSSDSGGRG